MIYGGDLWPMSPCFVCCDLCKYNYSIRDVMCPKCITLRWQMTMTDSIFDVLTAKARGPVHVLK